MRADLTIGGCGANDPGPFFVRDDPALVAQGWERRQLVDPDRAKETTELYRALGFEVLCKKLEPSDLGEDCESCAVAGCQGYVTIYTRRAQ